MNFGISGITEKISGVWGNKVSPRLASSKSSYMTPLSETSVKGHNVGRGIDSLRSGLDKVIIRQGEKELGKMALGEAAKGASKDSIKAAFKETAAAVGKSDPYAMTRAATEAGRKTFLGRIANMASKSLGAVGKAARGNYIVASLFEIPTWLKGVSEGKGVVSQTVHSGSKVVGAGVLAAKGAALGAAVGPIGAIAGGIVGGMIGFWAGDKVGGAVANSIRTASGVTFGTNTTKARPTYYAQQPPQAPQIPQSYSPQQGGGYVDPYLAFVNYELKNIDKIGNPYMH